MTSSAVQKGTMIKSQPPPSYHSVTSEAPLYHAGSVAWSTFCDPHLGHKFECKPTTIVVLIFFNRLQGNVVSFAASRLTGARSLWILYWREERERADRVFFAQSARHSSLV